MRLDLVVVLAAIVALGAGASGARAHPLDQSAMEMVVGPDGVEATLTLPTSVVAEADDDHDGALSDGEVKSHAAAIAAIVARGIQVSDSAGRVAALTVEPTTLPFSGSIGSARTHSTLRLAFRFPSPAEGIWVRYTLWPAGAPAPSCLATIVDERQGVQNHVFSPQEPQLALSARSLSADFKSFILMGIGHILTGYDHILFLISLLMVALSLTELIKVVTAFTLAHSLTLSLAVLDVVVLPSRLTESLIAATIAYVAAENLWKRDLAGRWRLTFLFGLVHGLGFASALRELHLPRSNLAMALLGFNGGVEIGQLVIVCVVFPLLVLARRHPAEPRVRRLVCGGVVAVALLWFVQRAFGVQVPFLPT